jgi:protocatechuate 3,4-dioxygenase beta subunit
MMENLDNDDLPVGRVLSRRETLTLLGTISAAMLAACVPGAAPAPAATTAASTGAVSATVPVTAAVAALPACIVRPELTEGPYFVDEQLERSDIRSDPATGAISAGIPLRLEFRVTQVNGSACMPLAGVAVDVWHCDAAGIYSDATDRSFNTVGQQFLRGYQRTGASGIAQFTTIYPGWYRGRAVHIHFKMRTHLDSNQGYEFTSQLFFDDNFTDVVHSREPYAAKGQRDLRNDGDGIYQDGGDQLVLNVVEEGDGYAAIFDIGLQV